MSSYTVWMDHDHAKIFNMESEPVAPVELKRSHHPHHSHHPKDGLRESETAFFESLAQSLEKASEILLMGPGLAKTEFRHFLATHKSPGLAERIAGIESSDHPTQGQILAAARKFFHARHPLDGTAPLARRG